MRAILCLFFPLGLGLVLWAQVKLREPWEIVETVGEAHGRHESAFVKVGEKFYALGGRRIQPVDIYDSVSLSWQKGARPPVEMHHFQAVVHEGKVVIGGAFTGKFPGETPLGRLYFYDAEGDVWSKGPVIPEERRRGSAGAVMRDGKLYLISGLTDGHRSGWVRWFDEYDFQSGEWRRLPDAPRARDHFQAVLVGDQLVLAGGRRSGEGGSVFDPVVEEVDIFDFSSGKWKTAASGMPRPRAGTMATGYGGKVMVIGGETGRAAAFTRVDLYDPERDEWKRLRGMDVGRHASQPIVHEDHLYIAAGSVTRGGTETNSLIRVPLR